MKEALLVGNGPSILDKPLGSVIDAFPGEVVRFNEFILEPAEYTGTRTDVWVIAHRSHSIENMHPDLVSRIAQVPRRVQYRNRRRRFRSTGIAAMFWYLREGYEVVLYGFDHFALDRRKNYYDHDKGNMLCREYVAGKPYHDKDKEMVEEAIKAGRPVSYLHERLNDYILHSEPREAETP